ncbi:L-histidine N(alpha)-methyltransferase [Novosphingobium sp. PC22D]|uniref:L-histidine N(alpha)-methyltransferase n=1 Tax=Novosphingobium sp. PC22D TaxID=1962403 RepID=UPI000BF142B3|nr:L-histidine N(alpha)-methyltransferase [Novosphingobium sp. PC22D]PEQ14658.1 L-histidine N(alpha)-methyltransferase [Novosphingobium sp. PC22D]
MATAASRRDFEFRANSLECRFRDDVLAGLGQERKAIPARWFYDTRGSEIFEEITQLPEYYPTRAEVATLEQHGGELGEAIGPDRIVVEFGAGSATKTPLLLDRIAPSAYVPIDIAGEFLRQSCAALAESYPDLPIFPIEADFTRATPIPSELLGHERLGFFPGSTIGNLEPRAAVDLLREMRATLGDGSLLLIGMDRIKAPGTLLAAYDDAAGVTARFNLNLARRINDELDGTIPLDALVHRAVWNEDRARIEMHLEATRDISFHVCARYFTLLAGETIHTENSHKYDEAGARTLLLAGGWEPTHFYSDRDNRFMVVLARAIETAITP